MYHDGDTLAAWQKGTEAGAAIISSPWHRLLLSLNKETSCPWGTIAPVQCVCVCVAVCALRAVPAVPSLFPKECTLCVCVCMDSMWMTSTTRGAEDWIGQDTLEDFLSATKRIWVVSTVWIIHFLHHIMSFKPRTYFNNVGLHPRRLKELPKLFFM